MRQVFRVFLSLGVALVAALAFTVPAQAGEASTTDGFRLLANTSDHIEYATPDGGKVGWASVSYTAAHPDLVKPASASGCNEQVCIDVSGDGLFVSQWATTAFTLTGGCYYAYYHAQSFSVTSPQLCGSAGTFYDESGPAGYYQDGEELCNNWSGIQGYPCIEIEA